MPTKKDDNATELSIWRASHFAELEATLTAFKRVRDDPETKAKDVIEAGKGIGRLLAAMSPDKVAVTASEEKDSAGDAKRNIPTLPPALKKRLKAILKNAD